MLPYGVKDVPNHGSPIEQIQNVSPIPLLIIRGKNDHMIPEDCAMALINKAKEPKEVWINEQGNHRKALQTYPEEYKIRVLGFLERNIEF